jgi:prevent-host-death family protein
LSYNGYVVTVASKELKNRLGKYLSIVRGGESVRITDRGRPVACILPASTPQEQQTAELLATLVAKGSVTLGSGKLPQRRKPAVLTPGKSIAEMIAEDRR